MYEHLVMFRSSFFSLFTKCYYCFTSKDYHKDLPYFFYFIQLSSLLLQHAATPPLCARPRSRGGAWALRRRGLITVVFVHCSDWWRPDGGGGAGQACGALLEAAEREAGRHAEAGPIPGNVPVQTPQAPSLSLRVGGGDSGEPAARARAVIGQDWGAGL